MGQSVDLYLYFPPLFLIVVLLWTFFNKFCACIFLRYSDTQTHQVAARKEKQMETLRSAFGIAASEPNEQSIEGSDDVRNGRKDGLGDDIKHYEKREHAFLDREFRGKKNMDEDQKVEKDDKKKGLKESRHHKKEGSKKRRHETDSSDTDSREENSKALQKKHRRGNRGNDRESDSDIEIGRAHV